MQDCSHSLAFPLATETLWTHCTPPAHARRTRTNILTAWRHRNYALSVILGTVALSYGSVPMYKMVSRSLLLSYVVQPYDY